MHQTFSELEDTGDEVPPDGPVDLEELERDLPPLLPIVKVSLLPSITYYLRDWTSISKMIRFILSKCSWL